MERVEIIDDLVKVRNVIISVSDKRRLETFVPALFDSCPGVRILSTGGTYKRLIEIMGKSHIRDFFVEEVSNYIGQPETKGGLVKTLDFKLFLGYLTETHNPSHQKDLRRTGAVPIDMAVFNLYPFSDTVAKEDTDAEDARMNIDVGGPSALRACAKNWHRVLGVVDPINYNQVINELFANNGHTTARTRYELSQKIWDHLKADCIHVAGNSAKTTFKEAIAPYEVRNPS